MLYPPVNKQFAIENGPVEIVDLPIDSMVIFHSYVTYVAVYQRVRHFILGMMPTKSSTFAVKRKPLQNSQTLSSHHKNSLVHGHVPQDPSIQWIVYIVSGKKIDNT